MLDHEYQDERIDAASELKSLRDFEAEEAHNAHWEMMHREFPERDWYADCEYE